MRCFGSIGYVRIRRYYTLAREDVALIDVFIFVFFIYHPKWTSLLFFLSSWLRERKVGDDYLVRGYRSTRRGWILSQSPVWKALSLRLYVWSKHYNFY